jgi:hypothetical protein
MIATAIGKLTAKVLTKVRANSDSKVDSGRICSNDMRLAPSLQIAKNRKSQLFPYARKAPQPACRLGLKWLRIG